MEIALYALAAVILLLALAWAALSIAGIATETVRGIRGAIDDYLRRR